MSESWQYEKSLAYFRDDFIPFGDANLSIASSPVLYGLSVYTVFSANWNEDHGQMYAFRLKDHYRRLVNSARIMGFEDFSKNYSEAKFEELSLELLRKNNIHENALIRATIFIDELIAGTRIEGLRNSFSMYAYPMGEILPRGGISVCVSSWQRLADNMIPARAKVNGSYVNASLMKNEALLNGFDDAIALDKEGHVTEGTVANLFIVRDGILVTPANSGDILEGITRSTCLRLAAELGLKHEERQIDRTELYIAEEAFMVGSSARITPILSIDHRPVGTGKPGPIAGQLSELYAAVQNGTDERLGEWRTPVYPN